MNDGAEVKVSPRVRAIVKKASAQEGEDDPARTLEMLVYHGAVYRAGGRIIKLKEAQ